MAKYSWKQQDDAVSDMEEKCVRGKGIFPATQVLRDIGYRSIYKKLFLAAADNIDELEARIEQLEEELRRERKYSSELGWEKEMKSGGWQGSA